MAKVVRAWAPFFAIAVPALGVMGLGLLQLGGWLVEPAWLIKQEGAPTMTAPTALGMVMAGAGLLAAYRVSLATLRLRLLVSVALVALCVAAPVMSLRMSPPAMIAFVITAVLLASHDRTLDRGRALLVQLLAGGLLALGVVSLIVHDLPIEGLLTGYRYSRMAATTAIGFLAIGLALLALIARAPWYESVYSRHEDEKILILVLGIFTLVLIGASTAAFAAMQRNLEAAVRGTLLQAVSDRGAILDSIFANRVARAGMVASRPSVADALARNDRERARAEGESFLSSGFTSLVFLDASSRPLVEVGTPSVEAPLEAAVAGEGAETWLVWNEGFLLRVLMPVHRGGALVGWVRSEQDLENFTRLQRGASELGHTAEWVLCAPRGESMDCFPQRFRARPWSTARQREGTPLPMDLALQGKRGVLLSMDYAGDRVIAGYAPAAQTGLGLVLKLATREFYAPLHHQLADWWRWILAIALVAMLLVSAQVRPVAQRLVASENLARTRSEALARSEASLRELYTSLADGIVVLSPSGTIEFANPAAEKLFGYGPGTLIGRQVSILIPEELRAANAEATRRFVEDGTSNVLGRGGLVFPALRVDGSRFDLEFSLARMGRGEEQKLVAVLRDVSERRALERMKGEFVATVSHELRTPLTSIMGALEIVRESEALPATEREFVEMAARNSERLAALVKDIIDTERIDSGSIEFDRETFELGPFLAEAVGMNQTYASTHHVFFYLEEPVPGARVDADRGRLMQVMANLLSNAAKFSREGEEVRVRGVLRAEHVRVEVSDRGPGIAEAFRARIFTRFAQADASDSRGKGGTGLGLAISKGIIERLGGRIGFEDAAGGGTTFWFELPLAP
jgi:PAS domain S-box-containing protein